MRTIQVKGVPDEVHSELRRRAEQRGMTIRGYVLELIKADQALPSMADWLEEVRELPRIDLGQPAADIIREERELRERQLDQRIRGPQDPR